MTQKDFHKMCRFIAGVVEGGLEPHTETHRASIPLAYSQK